MEGINPTLAFAAIFLGLAGHPRDAVESPIEQADVDWQLAFECGGLAMVMHYGGAAANNGFSLMPRSFVAIPARPNETYAAALEGSMLLIGDRSIEKAPSGSDAAMLLKVPAETISELHHDRGCVSLLAKP